MLGILLNNELQIKKNTGIIFYSLVKRHYSIYRLLRTLCSCTYEFFCIISGFKPKCCSLRHPPPNPTKESVTFEICELFKVGHISNDQT